MNFQTQRAKMGGGGELHQSISLKFQNTHHVEKSKNFQKKKKKKRLQETENPISIKLSNSNTGS